MKKKTKRRGRGEGACFFSEANNYWVARAVIGGERIERTAPTKGEVLDKIRLAREQGVPTDGAKTSLKQYLHHWLEGVCRPSVEASSYARHEQTARLYVAPYFGKHLIGRLKTRQVEEVFQRMRGDGVTEGNIHSTRGLLSMLLRHAQACEVIDRTPALPRIRKSKAPIAPFTPDEVRKILKAAQGRRAGVIFPLAIGTGMRIGEILGFGWQHVDFNTGVLKVERSLARGKTWYLKSPKTARGRRSIALPPFALEALRVFRAAHPQETETAICSRSGKLLPMNDILAGLHKPVLRDAGVPYRKFHTFRHTHASELLSRGVSVVEVARRLGDRPDVVLSTYAHWIPSGEDIPARLEEIYGENQ